MNRVEVFVISKNEGTMLHKYSILGMDDLEKDELTSGFLTALSSFAKDIGFPAGVSLIRSGTLEARFSAGKYVNTVLIIDYQMPLGLMTEPILSGLAQDITKLFEKQYPSELEAGHKKHFYKTDEFHSFKSEIDGIINRYGNETTELYQKLVLIESMYAKVPQKWCLPLIERVSNGEDVLDDFKPIIKKYPNMKRAIEKVEYDNSPLWEIFATLLYSSLYSFD
jgi:hypothetical protein